MSLIKVTSKFYESATVCGKSPDILYDIPYIKKMAEGDFPDTEWAKPLYELYKKDKKVYFQAVLNGYEVEQTPEDKVKEYIKQLNADHGVWSIGHQSNTSPYGHELTGCLRTLNLLNIKISGVNDK